MFQTVFSVEPLKKHKKNVLIQSKTDFEMSNYMSHIMMNKLQKRGKTLTKSLAIF